MQGPHDALHAAAKVMPAAYSEAVEVMHTSPGSVSSALVPSSCRFGVESVRFKLDLGMAEASPLLQSCFACQHYL